MASIDKIELKCTKRRFTRRDILAACFKEARELPVFCFEDFEEIGVAGGQWISKQMSTLADDLSSKAMPLLPSRLVFAEASASVWAAQHAVQKC